MKNSSYCLLQGRKPINWKRRIERGLWGYYSDAEFEKWVRDSLHWVTCACGNECNEIPRWHFGAPKDKQLRKPGCLFSSAIRRHDFNEAKGLLDKIEAKSKSILLKINQK